MFNAVKEKLNNRRGVSILISLLAFLVAAMVCAVIIAAALASARAVRSDFDEEQVFLTVESAERLVENDINGGKLVMVEHWDVTDSIKDDSSKTCKFITAWLNDICRESIKDMAEDIIVDRHLSSTRTFTVSAVDEDGEDSLDDVKMTLTMEGDPEEDDYLSITAEFELKDGSSLKSRTSPKLTAIFMCSSSSVDADTETYSSTETTLTWTLYKVTNS